MPLPQPPKSELSRTLAEPLSEHVTEGLSFLRAGTGHIHLKQSGWHKIRIQELFVQAK